MGEENTPGSKSNRMLFVFIKTGTWPINIDHQPVIKTTGRIKKFEGTEVLTSFANIT